MGSPKGANPQPTKLSFFYGILGLAFLNLLLFGDVLWSGRGLVLSSGQTDLFLHFVAWREFAFGELRRGHLVLWNPHYLCGAPFLGGFEEALLYPPNWFYLVLPIGSAINFGIVLHVFLAGLFTYLWAWHKKLHPLACFISGVVFMWGGAYFLHLYAGHLPNLCAMVWAPLIFLALDGWMESLREDWILLGVFAVSMQVLAGHPQYVYFTAILVFLYALLNLWRSGSKWKIFWGATAFYGGAFFLTAAQLWTGFEAFLECGRNMAIDYKVAGSFSFPPENLFTLVFPSIFGNLENHSYWGRWFYWEVNLFMGASGFFLALLSLGKSEKKKREWILVAALLALIFSFGVYTPLFRLFYEFAPGFQGLRGICKFDFLAALFFALLAGIGMDRFLKSPRTPKWLSLSWTLAGITALALGTLTSLSLREGFQGYWGRWFATLHWLQKTVAALDVPVREAYIRQSGEMFAQSLWKGGGLCLVLSFLLWLRPRSRKAAYATAALVVLELFAFARANRPTFELALLEKKIEQVRDIYRQDPGDYRIYGTGADALAAGGFDIWEDEPMVLGSYGRFVCRSQGLNENQLFSVSPVFTKFSKIFGLLRLKYLVSIDSDPIRLTRMPFKLFPRMRLVDGWETIPGDAPRLARLLDPTFRPDQKVLLEKDPIPRPVPGTTQGQVRWKDISTEETEVEVDTPRPTLLLITDNYSRGWRAIALPGSAQDSYKVLPGDYFLRAIPLARGHHHFLMEYRPLAFEVGRWISIVSCLVYVGILLFRFRAFTSH